MHACIMGSGEKHIISSIVRVCQKLDSKGFGANHDGNVSVKFGDKIFATPTAVSKDDITADMIIELDLSGNKIAGAGKPFSEMALHLAAYNSRPDIRAVVHAHPPYATARGLANLPLNRPSIPESVVSIGDNVPVAPFAMPGDKAGEKAVADILQISNVFMMCGNGVLSVGQDITQAYLRLELVEHLAKIDFIAKQTGDVHYLSNEETNKLLEKHFASGLGAPKAGARGKGQGASEGNIEKIIADAVSKIIGK